MGGTAWGSERASRAILELLAQRRSGATICPSEAARRLDAENWRDFMDEIRAAAAALAAVGRVVVMQKGRPVDIADARGPVRLGLPQDPAAS
ncbi:MAG: DUF3253 domain-containing protein [Pseudomonadota bacterium]